MTDKDSQETTPEAAEHEDTSTATAEDAESHDHDHGHDHDHDHGHHPHHDHDHEEEFEFVEDPTYNVDYKGECAYEVGVSIPPANLKKQASEVFDELKDEAQVPGFRRGKVPRKLLERKFGKHVRGEVMEKLVSAAFRKLVKDQDLRPISLPDIEGLEDLKELPEDSSLDFTLKFEVAPRCELGQYRGIEVDRPVLKIDDQDIDEAIDELRGRHATYEALADAEAAEGDQVIIDFHGTIEGEDFPGNKAENYPYIVGSKRFFGAFEEALVGAKAGAELTADVPFPDDYAEHLAGKTANFKIKVNEVKRKSMPEANDEFAKDAGHESMQEMREKIANDLREGAMQQSNTIAERRAMDTIVEASTFELPKSMLDSVAKEYYEQETRRLMSLRMPASKIEEMEEDLRKAAQDHAVREIKGYVAVNEIADAEGVAVTEEDFEQEAESIAQRTGAEMQLIQKFLTQSDQHDEYAGRIFRRKAMAVVMDNAKITDSEVTRDELDEEHDDDEEDS
jgi:trigger factor